jgi:hypothetical protein
VHIKAKGALQNISIKYKLGLKVSIYLRGTRFTSIDANHFKRIPSPLTQFVPLRVPYKSQFIVSFAIFFFLYIALNAIALRSGKTRFLSLLPTHVAASLSHFLNNICFLYCAMCHFFFFDPYQTPHTHTLCKHVHINTNTCRRGEA